MPEPTCQRAFIVPIVCLAVHPAIADVGYRGYVTTEIAGGDAAYLKDVANRVDRFLAGQKPV
jgi:hypothetical protein